MAFRAAAVSSRVDDPRCFVFATVSLDATRLLTYSLCFWKAAVGTAEVSSAAAVVGCAAAMMAETASGTVTRPAMNGVRAFMAQTYAISA